MIQLAGFATVKKEDKKYLEKIASETVSDGLRYVYSDTSGKISKDFSMIMDILKEMEFFNGLSQYIHDETDETAGLEFVKRKTKRMIEKADELTESYTYDALECLLLNLASIHCRMNLQYNNIKYDSYDPERQKEVKEELEKRFLYKEKDAEEIAEKMTNFHEVALKDKEKKNIFFPNDDFNFVFIGGFVDGIRIMKSYDGELWGYGYDYAREIFTDIGLKPPLLLLGTREANEIARKEEKRLIEEEMMEDMMENEEDWEFLDELAMLRKGMEENEDTDEDPE